MPRPKVLLVNLCLPTYYPLALFYLKAYAEKDPAIARRFDIECLTWPTKITGSLKRAGMTFSELLQRALWVTRRRVPLRKKLGQFKGLFKRYRWVYLVYLVLTTRYHEVRLILRILRSRPAVLGFSVYLWNLEASLRVARWVKRLLPRTVILLGGQEVTNSRIDFFRRYPFLDLIVDGEGEIVFTEFLRHFNPENPAPSSLPPIQGLLRREDPVSKSVKPDHKLDLSQLPSPYLNGMIHRRQLFDSQLNGMGIMLELARGCRFKCRFCFESERAQALQTFPAQRFREEFQHLWKMGIRKFHILDPNLVDNNLTRLQEFDRVIEETGGTAEGLFISAEMYPEFVTEQNLPYLRYLRITDLGLQSTHPAALRAIRRYFDSDKFLRGVEMLNRVGKHTNIYLILGLPADTIGGFLESLLYSFRAKPVDVFVNHLCVLNGTSLRDIAEEYQIQYKSVPPYSVISTSTLSEKQLKYLGVISKSLCDEYNVNYRAVNVKLPTAPSLMAAH